jgi:hypothetical protein
MTKYVTEFNGWIFFRQPTASFFGLSAVSSETNTNIFNTQITNNTIDTHVELRAAENIASSTKFTTN